MSRMRFSVLLLLALLLWLAVSLMVRGAQLFFEKRRKASTDDSS